MLKVTHYQLPTGRRTYVALTGNGWGIILSNGSLPVVVHTPRRTFIVNRRFRLFATKYPKVTR